MISEGCSNTELQGTRSKQGHVLGSYVTRVLHTARINNVEKRPMWRKPGGGGVLPYMGYIGMCGPKGYGFSAVLVINRVSIIAILPPLW